MRLRIGSDRVVLFGTTGAASRIALEALLAANVAVCAVAIYDRTAQPIQQLLPARQRSVVPLVEAHVRRSCVELAWQVGLPVYAIGDLAAPDTCALFAQLAPDLGCAACFPARIPPELLTIPHAGFLNLHPALLPRHRGPAPLFWTMQAGELRTGVTVHWMDAYFDTGPIALQQVLELPEGVGYSRADQQLWEAGALLLVEALNAHATGMLARRAQPPEASYEPWPGQADFTLDPTWSARRAFIFMRGVAEWGHPFHLRASTATLEVAHAIGYNPTGQLGAAFQIADDQIHIQFTPGILHARGLLR